MKVFWWGWCVTQNNMDERETEVDREREAERKLSLNTKGNRI